MRTSTQKPWHREPDQATRAAALLKAGAMARLRNRTRAADAKVFAQVIDNTDSGLGVDPGISYQDSNYAADLSQSKILRNTARSVARTALAKIGAISVDLPQWMSTGGDFTRQQAAADLTRFCEVIYKASHGAFASLDALHRHGFYLASAVTGAAAVFPEVDPTGRIQCHLDDTLTMAFERGDIHSRAHGVVRTRYFTPDELAGLYPKHEALIWQQPTVKMGRWKGRGCTYSAEVIPVVQGWRFRVCGRPGLRMFVLPDGTVLESKKYDSEEMPCALYVFEREVGGEFGVPLTRIILDDCLAENSLLVKGVRAVGAMASVTAAFRPEDFVDGGEGLANMGNVQAFALQGPPAVPGGIAWNLPPEPVAPFDVAERLRAAAFNTSGVSEAQATSMKSKGTESGRHEAMVASLTSERFAAESRDLTIWRAEDTAKVVVRAAAEARKKAPKAKVAYRPKDRDPKELVLADLDLEGADEFVLTVAPVDEGRATPKARLEQARTWLEAGRITPAEYFNMETHLDTQAMQDDMGLVRRWVAKQVEKWLELPEADLLGDLTDVVETPEASLGLEALMAALRQASFARLDAKMHQASAERIGLFDTFIEYTEAIIKDVRAQEAALTQQAGGQAPPGMIQ